MIQPNKNKAKSYDDNFLDHVANSDLYKNWSTNKKNTRLATTSAFNTEQHRVNFNSSNQDELKEGVNPFLNQFVDLQAEDPYNELRANNQSGFGQVGLGLGRIGSKVVREVTKTAGALSGLGLALAENTSDLITGEDNHDFLQTTFDNAFIKGTDELFDNANEALLPVYVSDTVKNGGFFDKVTSSEFWATEGADGVGYMISAFAPGAALKALGVSESLFGAATKLTSLRYGKSLEVARRELTMAGVTANKIDSFIIPAANTFFEAGAESKGVGDDIEQRKPEAKIEFFKNLDVSSKEFQNKVLLKSNQLDLDRRAGKISIDEYNQLGSNLTNTVAEELFENNFKEQKSYAIRNTFLTNLAILAGPNYIQAKLLFGQNESKNLLKQLIQKPSKEGLKKAGTRVLESFASEGSEEVAQTSTEHRQTNKAIASKLHGGLDALKDISPGEFSKDFIKTLGTTEGQVAGFLGGFLGSGVSVVTGYKQDIKDATENKRLLDKIKNAGTSLNDINLDSFEKEVVKNDQGEDIEIFKKDEKGNKILNIENVQKIKKALDYHEELSEIYDNAVEKGDVETIQKVKKLAEHDLIMNFVGENEITIDALKEHLKEILPSEVEDKTKSKENQNRQNDIIEKAKYLQKELVSFQNMSTSIIKLENKNSTPKQVKSFMGNLQNEFLKETSLLYELRKEKQELIKDKAKLESETTLEEIDNPHFNKDLSHEFDKKVIGRIENPRLKIVIDKLTDLNKNIKDKESFLNYGVWNTKIVNGAFNLQISELDIIKKAISDEKVKELDSQISQIKNTKELKDLDKIKTDNPFIKDKLAERRKEIIQEQQAADEAVNEQNRQDKANGVTTTTTPIPTGDIVIDNDLSDTTDKPVEESDNIDDLKGKVIEPQPGAKVTSTVMLTGEKFDFVSQEFIDYERNGLDKSKDSVGFELNTSDKVSENQSKALEMVNKGDFSDLPFLYSHLPINAKFNGKVSAPLETLSEKEGSEEYNKIFREQSVPIRKAIIDELAKGTKLEDISSNVVKQFPGVLKVQPQVITDTNERRTPVNSIKDLNFFKGMKGIDMLKEFAKRAYFVYYDGQLTSVNDLSNQKSGIHKGKGEVFVEIPQNNGNPFMLKLNFKRIGEEKGSAIYEIIKALSDLAPTEANPNPAMTSVKDFITNASDNVLFEMDYIKEEIALLYKIYPDESDQTIDKLLDLLVYQKSDNPKTLFKLDEGGNLRMGTLSSMPLISKSELDTEESRLAVLEFLKNKKHNVLITEPKGGKFTFNNPAYLNYLLDNNIISTNAVINEPTFQGYSNIYLNQSVTNKSVKKEVASEKVTIPTVSQPITTSTQSEIEAKKAEIERRRQEELLTPSKLQQPTTDTFILDYRNRGKKIVEEAVKYNASEYILKVINLALKGRSAKTIAKESELSKEDVTLIRFYLGIPSSGGVGLMGAVTDFTEDEQKSYDNWKNEITKINAKYDAELAKLKVKPQLNIEYKIQEVIKNKEFIKLSEDGSKYVNTKTGQTYQRVTEYISENKIESTPLLESSQIIGTKIDELVRDYFAGELKDLNSYNVTTEVKIKSFIKSLDKIKAEMDSRGEIVLANDIVLYNDIIGVAGTVDLLTYDKNGDVRIYDMKTMRGNNFEDSYNGDENNKYESTRYGKSKKQSHTDQLSLYRILLNNTHGLDAVQLGVMPIEISYDAGDVTTSELKLLKGVKIDRLDKVKKAEIDLKEVVNTEVKPQPIQPTPKPAEVEEEISVEDLLSSIEYGSDVTTIPQITEIINVPIINNVSIIEKSISEIFSRNSLINFNENQPGHKVNGEFIPNNLGEQIFGSILASIKGEKINKLEANKLFREYVKEIHPDKYQNEIQKEIAEIFFKAISEANSKGRVDILNELKKQFETEINKTNIKINSEIKDINPETLNPKQQMKAIVLISKDLNFTITKDMLERNKQGKSLEVLKEIIELAKAKNKNINEIIKKC